MRIGSIIVFELSKHLFDSIFLLHADSAIMQT